MLTQKTDKHSFDIMNRPAPSAILELLKPITWFAPMWAFGCGVVSSGLSLTARWEFVIAGIFLAGPLVCATSQAVNDWYDRHVDAINEPGRPIPSGRIPGRWGFYIACLWTVLSLLVATALGQWVFSLAIGDGALGFWKAMRQVWDTTKEQRCWVHKTANVLDKLPKGSQPKAKRMLHDIYQAEGEPGPRRRSICS